MKIYQAYEQKILKLAEIKAKILRYKYLILACLLVLIAGFSTLMSFKGNIQKDIQLQPQYTYGDTISCQAKAFLSTANIVFYKDGKEVDYPNQVGTYDVRAVARGAFWSKKYGATHTIEILPKSATMKINSFAYGEEPTVSVSGLVNGDTLDTEKLKFNYLSVEDNIQNMSIASGSFHILNKKGEDVTDCYQFSSDVYATQSVVWRKRDASITTGDAQKLFDGKPFDKPNYQVSGLLEEDVLTVKSYCMQTQAGRYENFLTYEVKNAKGEKVTDKYAFTEKWGQLIIFSEKIVISVSGKSVYNDKEVKNFTAVCKKGVLLEGDKIIITEARAYDANNQITAVKEVGTYKIEIISYKIQGADYLVELEMGEYIVEKCPITVKVKDAEKYYDRTPLTSNAFTSENVVKGHSVQIECGGSITEPGKEENRLNSVLVYNASKQDVTKNYQITYENGWLTVHKRKVSVTPLPVTKTYDGKPIAYPEQLSKEAKIIVSWTDGKDALAKGTALLSGDYVDYSSISFASAIVNVGETRITIKNAYVKYANGQTDNGKYYELTVVDGKGVVNPAYIEVGSLSYTKVYDGQDLVGKAGDCYILKGQLTDNTTIEYKVNGRQSEVGVSLNLISEVRIKQGSKTVGYVKCDSNGQIIDGNDNPDYNYIIILSHGNLTLLSGN